MCLLACFLFFYGTFLRFFSIPAVCGNVIFFLLNLWQSPWWHVIQLFYVYSIHWIENHTLNGPVQCIGTEQENSKCPLRPLWPSMHCFCTIDFQWSHCPLNNCSSSLWLDPADRCVGTWRQGDFVFHQTGGKLCLTHDSETDKWHDLVWGGGEWLCTCIF